MTSRRIKEVRAAGDCRQAIEGGLTREPEKIEVTAFGDPEPVFIDGQEELIIKIPALPPVEYSQNSRGHWAKKAAAGKLYKQQVAWTLINSKKDWQDIGPLASARMQVIYHVAQRRKRDQDNAIARLKPALDGLVASGLFLDDEHITIIEPVEFQKTTDEPWLELRLIDWLRAAARE